MKRQSLIHRTFGARLPRGFTLVELMVTLSVLGILTAIAIPSLTQLLANSRVVGAVNEYTAGINLARSTAVNTGLRVTLCAASGPGTCIGSGNAWTSGWIVFIDDGANPGTIEAGETVLLDRSTWVGMASVTGSASYNSISYVASGRPETALPNNRLTFIPQGDSSAARYVCISRNGRPRLSESAC